MIARSMMRTSSSVRRATGWTYSNELVRAVPGGRRPLDADVGAATVDGGAGRPRRLLQQVGQLTAHGLRHPDVGDDALAEERGHAAPRPVEELVGHHQIERPDLLLRAAHRRDGDHPFGAQRLQPPDVRAEIELARAQTVAPTVARQEDHRTPIEPAGAELVRRIAERRTDAAPAHLRESLQLV